MISFIHQFDLIIYVNLLSQLCTRLCFAGCGDTGDLGHLLAGGVHELPAVPGSTTEQAQVTAILPRTHQRI